MNVLAIDPGPETSGVVHIVDGKPIFREVLDNKDISPELLGDFTDTCVAIEMIAHYGTGMPAGKSVFLTCVEIGKISERFESADITPRLVERGKIKLWLCGTARAKDANIRQALLDRFPASGGGKTPQIGTKQKPGLLYGFKSHLWAALALALYAAETNLTNVADAA
jgi:hypothetical protein